MANKMLVDRVDVLEIRVKQLYAMLDLSGEFIRLINKKLPQYDMLLEHRKLGLSKAKAMRLAKRKKRQEISDRKDSLKSA